MFGLASASMTSVVATGILDVAARMSSLAAQTSHPDVNDSMRKANERTALFRSCTGNGFGGDFADRHAASLRGFG
jgi:hypothetical protein